MPHTGTVGIVRTRRTLLAAAFALVVLPAGAGSAAIPDDPRGNVPAIRVDTLPRAWAMAGEDDVARARPLPIPTGWGPNAAEISRARELVADLTLRQRAGQVIHAEYVGTSSPTGLVNRLHLGGVVVFSGNYRGTEQIRLSNRTLQQSAREAGREFPVAIGVDQEGGLVERVTGGTRLPTFMTAGAAGRPLLTRAAAVASGRELAALGFTTDYAPVADVTLGRADPTIGARSAGVRPRVVAAQTVAAARGYRSAGVISTLKHFPGHGSVTADSHLTLPVQQKSVRELAAGDFVPFRAGVDAGLPSVMVGHIDVRSVDPGTPSSLSRPVVEGLLRGRLGFDGLVVTDSLTMQAVADRFPSGLAAVRALRAGADVVLMPVSARGARDGILRAVQSGRLSSERLAQAATRQVALLIHQRNQRNQDISPALPGAGGAASYRWSAAAITSVAGPCQGRLVGSRVKVTGPGIEVSRFRAAASAAGLAVGRGGTTVRLVGIGGDAVRGDVVVAMDTPYVLGDSSAPVKLATYGTTYGAMAALVDVLLGRRGAPGALPVPVVGVPRGGC